MPTLPLPFNRRVSVKVALVPEPKAISESGVSVWICSRYGCTPKLIMIAGVSVQGDLVTDDRAEAHQKIGRRYAEAEISIVDDLVAAEDVRTHDRAAPGHLQRAERAVGDLRIGDAVGRDPQGCATGPIPRQRGIAADARQGS